MASISLLTTTAPPLFLPIPSPSASPIRISYSLPLHHHKKLRTRLTLHASAVSAPSLSKPDDLVNALLSKVEGHKIKMSELHPMWWPSKLYYENVDHDILKVVQTDRGVLLTTEEHGKVAEMASDLESFCVDEPVKCPLIFGEWDVVYCSNPTSPGGLYRSAIGRLFFKTKEMIQVLEAPDTVRNKVSFSLFGFLDGEVSLKGKLNVLDEKWIQVVFESPEIKIGGLETRYGGESEVKLEIIYIDEKMRLGKGSRGSLFVFQRRGTF